MKGKYSTADIGTWPWVKGWKSSGFRDKEMSKFLHLWAGSAGMLNDRP